MRLLVVQHLYAWSYQETVARVTDSVVLRWFCRVSFQHVPVATTVLRWAATIQPATLPALNDRVALLAKQARVTQGRQLRLDSTCVQTAIHHPTDSGLLVAGVRVLTRAHACSRGSSAKPNRWSPRPSQGCVTCCVRACARCGARGTCCPAKAAVPARRLSRASSSVRSPKRCSW